jgi:hypothetical protein
MTVGGSRVVVVVCCCEGRLVVVCGEPRSLISGSAQGSADSAPQPDISSSIFAFIHLSHQLPTTNLIMPPRIRASIPYNSRYPQVGRSRPRSRRNVVVPAAPDGSQSLREEVTTLRSEIAQLKNQLAQTSPAAIQHDDEEHDGEEHDGEDAEGGEEQDDEEQPAEYEDLREFDIQPDELQQQVPDRGPEDDPRIEFEIFDRQYRNDDEPAEDADAAPDANMPDDPFLVAFTLWCDMFGITRLAYSVFVSFCSLVCSNP